VEWVGEKFLKLRYASRQVPFLQPPQAHTCRTTQNSFF
jgi:hypothetical protein